MEMSVVLALFSVIIQFQYKNCEKEQMTVSEEMVYFLL